MGGVGGGGGGAGGRVGHYQQERVGHYQQERMGHYQQVRVIGFSNISTRYHKETLIEIITSLQGNMAPSTQYIVAMDTEY